MLWVLDLREDPLGAGDTGIGVLRGVTLGADDTAWSVGPAYGNPGVVAVRDGRIQGRLDGVGGLLAAAPDGTVFSRVPRGYPCGHECVHADGQIIRLSLTEDGVVPISSMRVGALRDEGILLPPIAVGPRGLVFTVVNGTKIVATCQGQREMWSRHLRWGSDVTKPRIRRIFVDDTGSVLLHIQSAEPLQSRPVVLSSEGEIIAGGALDEEPSQYEVVLGFLSGEEALVLEGSEPHRARLEYRSSVAVDESWSATIEPRPAGVRLLPGGRAYWVEEGPVGNIQSKLGSRELEYTSNWFFQSMVQGESEVLFVGGDDGSHELRIGRGEAMPGSSYEVIEVDIDGWRPSGTDPNERAVSGANDMVALSPDGVAYVAAGRFLFALSTPLTPAPDESCMNSGCNAMRTGRIHSVFDVGLLAP
ncbi:MAG TPA: hypothetical protein RMH85_13115 [Polyangiaceae bacterium LLY-WYZ-15_(1-7)]|nr:hypothetical protein [Polyangiaceae bacterium LLY-WYZ-15_(1-7)]HJL03518.1 hypothetical protein [Polyangiaceae bacterium LLY-WYZ-15_(1-7)]HJL09440.1 hypothetical protein [Polyangiaceae bacterium LLY-WYZ-15_(1-7)]HJL25116.1 hypothetical protein [Polyangiaceae bacterium LLY-WYZ-15_(1-7)]HJL28714.1 hypothetical protein [Polyangiaceae bacterium LLY-WYZ-15_(1-7)]